MDRDIPRGYPANPRALERREREIFSLSGRPCGGEASQPEIQLASVIKVHW
jgi:hypothetical protein